jgi:hypothetical protein
MHQSYLPGEFLKRVYACDGKTVPSGQKDKKNQCSQRDNVHRIDARQSHHQKMSVKTKIPSPQYSGMRMAKNESTENKEKIHTYCPVFPPAIKQMKRRKDCPKLLAKMNHNDSQGRPEADPGQCPELAFGLHVHPAHL